MTEHEASPPAGHTPVDPAAVAAQSEPRERMTRETGGPQGPEPTRYGDWERAGRCIDF